MAGRVSGDVTYGQNTSRVNLHVYTYIEDCVKPPNKGHFGANSFVPCGENVPISEVKINIIIH